MAHKNWFVSKVEKNELIPITIVTQKNFEDWVAAQDKKTKTWLKASGFRNKAGSLSLLPDGNGNVSHVYYCVSNENHFWEIGGLPLMLPEGIYTFGDKINSAQAVAWGLGAYQFIRYKKPQRQPAQLLLPAKIVPDVQNVVDSITLVRDLINTPTDDMGPSELAAEAKSLAKTYHATFSQIIGEALLKENYPSIYTVGRASDDAPRLIDLRWGNPKHPKLTLIGKGVCFDTGGLDLKSSAYMALMKKDMAGGAHALGLAKMIMQAKLPIFLRVLIPAVENAVSGNAYRPGDIIKSRKGTTIEIGNTDAEGRVILADAITEAVSEKPDLLIDLTTLTGAARVAVGTDLAAVFSNNDDLVTEVMKCGEQENDLMWRLPLYAPYRDYLQSQIADINNNSSEPYGGAITAALFLKEFVPDDIPWLHFDMMAWNVRPRPGRPQGGEAMAIRGLFRYLQERFAA